MSEEVVEEVDPHVKRRKQEKVQRRENLKQEKRMIAQAFHDMYNKIKKFGLVLDGTGVLTSEEYMELPEEERLEDAAIYSTCLAYTKMLEGDVVIIDPTSDKESPTPLGDPKKGLHTLTPFI